MKKALLTLMCLAAMMAAGTILKAQEVTVVLNPGWNWISFPTTDTLDISEALGSFTPMVGDIVKSKWGHTSYRGNGQWRGNVSQFYPGNGYHYKSNREMPVTITIGQPLPQLSVTTAEPTDITALSAMVGGTVAIGEGNHLFLRGVCWGTEENPTIDGDHIAGDAVAGGQDYTLDGLTPNTIYYIRAYMVTDHGLAYGEEITFTTMSGIPVVTTAEVTGITTNSAICGGTVTDDGGLEVTARGVCWSTSSNPTITDSHTDGTGTGSFVSTLTGLTPNTTYYVRSYATNSHVTVYGNQRSFTTEPLPSYTVTVSCNPAEGGTATGGDTYEQGQSCTLTATANSGYTFSNWTENGSVVSTSATYTFTVEADRTLVANFTAQSYTISASANPSAGGSVSGGGSYNYGSSCTLTAMANSGYTFSNWTENGEVVSTDATYSFTVDADRTLVANFTAQSYTISASASPLAGGSVSGGGSYNYGSSCTLTATANTGYTFSLWKENGSVVSTSATYTFSVGASRTLVAYFCYVGGGGGHAYVDLGLPSGTLWATCNVGADNPEDYGDYFAWGETQPKDTYNWSTYQYCMGSDNTLTKYCSNSNYGYNGFTDDLTTLLPEDDAATANWGSDWRMPTKEEWEELKNNTTVIWTTQNGVRGRLFTASNGNSLFLPAAGDRGDSNLYDAGSCGYYWSSSLYTAFPLTAWEFDFNSGYYYMNYYDRDVGQSVRPVRSASQN